MTLSAQEAEISPARVTDRLQQFVRMRSVNGEDSTAHLWLTAWLREMGFEVEHYSVEGRRTPLVLGVLEGEGDEPGVLFDGHYDTVHAVPSDWSRNPWGGDVVDGMLYGRGAVDSKGTDVAMLMAIEAFVRDRATRRGPIYYMSDSDGEDGFRGATLMADLGITNRVSTVFSSEATSNRTIEIAYPGISAWKITALGRSAHPTEPEEGINAVTKMAKLVAAVDARRLVLPGGDSRWFGPRVTVNAIRTLPGGGWTIPGRCDAVLSILTASGVAFGDIKTAIDGFLRELEAEDGEVRFEFKVVPMGAGRLWLRPGETDPSHPGVAALAQAVREVGGAEPTIKEFTGGWVDAVELMRPGANGFGSPAAITFGAGEFDQAHAVDEHVPIAEVVKAAEIYRRALGSLLSGPPGGH